MQPGDQIELKVTPDPYLTVRYAGASGDFNPIHIDEAFAQQVGLPGRILHGLWMMAEVARAHTEAAGGPETLKRLSVQFRGMGVLGEELVVSGTVREAEAEAEAEVEGEGEGQAEGQRLTVASEVHQSGRRLIKGATADVVPSAGA